MKKDEGAPETRLIHTRKARLDRVTVNPPVERASTVVFRDEASLYGPTPTYGRMGLTVHRELQAAAGELEGAAHTRLLATPAGLRCRHRHLRFFRRPSPVHRRCLWPHRASARSG